MKIGSLRLKLVVLILLALVPLFLLLVNTAQQEQRRIFSEVRLDAVQLASLMAGTQETILKTIQELLMTLAQVDSIRDPSLPGSASLLRNLTQSSAVYSNLGVCDASGRVRGSALPAAVGRERGGESWFADALAERALAIGEYHTDPATGRPVVTIGYPVLRGDGEPPSGAVFVDVDLVAASGFNERIPLRPGGYMAAVDAENRIILRYPDPEKWIGRKDPHPLRATLGNRSSAVALMADTDGEERFFALRNIDGASGKRLCLGVGLKVESQTPLHLMHLRRIGVLGGIAAITVAAVWLLGSRYLVRPARHLVSVAREVSGGNLAARSRLSPSAGEFFEIGSAFNQMAHALGIRIAELHATRHDLQEAHDELEARVERRTAELHRARERLVDAIENIDAGFAMFGPDDRLVICNESFRAFCAPAEAKNGIPFAELLREMTGKGGVPEAHAPQWIEETLERYRRADGTNIEGRLRGRWFWCTIHRTRDGGAVILITDVTLLKQMKENLLLRNRAIASLNSGVVVTDPALPDNPIVDANPAFERITGYTREEVLGRNCRFLQREDSSPEAREAMRRGIQEERDTQVVILNYRKDGTSFWNETKITPVRDSAGRLTHFVGVMTDVTERERARAALERTAEELRRSNEELERFAYVASHDLQEPLRMVASYTQLLARRYRDKLDQNANDFIQYAVDGAERMQAFIRDLLQYSRVGTQGRPFEPVDLGELVGRVLENFRLAIEEAGAKVTVHPLPVVDGDPVQLLQLFQNLLGNAFKFRDAARPLRVEVAASTKDGFQEIVVSDNGIGLDPADAERIFVIFQRLHTRQEYEGTGIGLSIAKKIVERHGGRIWVESRKGEGAAFHFTIPERRG